MADTADLKSAPARGEGSSPSSPTETQLRENTLLQAERERFAQEAASVATLRASDEFKTALLAAVSHDLETLVASIMASISNCRRRKDPAWSAGAHDGEAISGVAGISSRWRRAEALR